MKHKPSDITIPNIKILRNRFYCFCFTANQNYVSIDLFTIESLRVGLSRLFNKYRITIRKSFY